MSTKQVDFKIEHATKEDWNEILKLLEETNLTFWMTGTENYNDFYVVKDPLANNLICCFAIIHKNNIGILKSFGVRKEKQGKGIGKQIANEIPGICKKLGINKLYAACEEPQNNFWGKTFLKEIKYNEAKDDLFLNYTSIFIDKVPNYFEIEHFFLWETI